MSKLITRTFEESNVTVMCVDTETAEVSNETFHFAYAMDNEKALKVCKKLYESATTKIVAVVDNEVTETLRGMTEETFLANSIVLDPVTRKPIL